MIKRLMFKNDRKALHCLKCNAEITALLIDNMIFTCDKCGQTHYIDMYEKSISLTVTERPDIRRRHKENNITEAQLEKRRLLIKKVTEREKKNSCEEWFREVAEMPEAQQREEIQLMGEPLRREYEDFLERRLYEHKNN